MSTADELAKLGALRDSGVLTDVEFASEKAKLLTSHPQTAAAIQRTQGLIGTPADAESKSAAFMRQIGFADAKPTSSGRDGGIDVKATGAVAQVKMQWKPVGRPVLQQLHGAARGRKEFFFSLQGYSDAARRWGDEVGMALFRFDVEGRFSPVNKRAKDALAAVEAKRTLQLGSAEAAAQTARILERGPLVQALADAIATVVQRADAGSDVKTAGAEQVTEVRSTRRCRQRPRRSRAAHLLLLGGSGPVAKSDLTSQRSREFQPGWSSSCVCSSRSCSHLRRCPRS